jgi:Rrf2 family protein
MMSKKCKYAIKALVRLGKANGEIMRSSDIATLENIPKKFLEHILIDLKAHHIVASKQGNVGGYYLIKSPSNVTLADVHRIFDGAMALVPCAAVQFYQPCDDCIHPETCTMSLVFTEIRNKTYQLLADTTIQTFIDKGQIEVAIQ